MHKSNHIIGKISDFHLTCVSLNPCFYYLLHWEIYATDIRKFPEIPKKDFLVESNYDTKRQAEITAYLGCTILPRTVFTLFWATPEYRNESNTALPPPTKPYLLYPTIVPLFRENH